MGDGGADSVAEVAGEAGVADGGGGGVGVDFADEGSG